MHENILGLYQACSLKFGLAGRIDLALRLNGFFGPNFCNFKGIWNLKPQALGSWTL